MNDRKLTIYPSMILKTVEEAKTKRCPFNKDKFGYLLHCMSDDCMSWVEALSETSREDHSGGSLMMHDEARFRGVEATREGPGGSMGHIDVPAVGFCKRLWKEIQYD